MKRGWIWQTGMAPTAAPCYIRKTIKKKIRFTFLI